MREIYLILNADDFGMCHSYNEAVFHLLEEHKISSATLMPVTPGCEEAVSWCLKHKPDCVGLHTTFTSEWPSFRWGSLSGRASLTDADGFFYPDVASFLQHASEADIQAELEAQFSFFAGTGIFFSHADNHMGSLYPYPDQAVPGYLPLVFRQCARYGHLPFRMFRQALYEDRTRIPASYAQPSLEAARALGIPLIDSLYSYPFHPKEQETYESFRQEIIDLVYRLLPGINELYFHPSVDSEEVRGICSSWQRRVWEFRLLFDSEFTYALQDAGIQLINYQKAKEYNHAV